MTGAAGRERSNYIMIPKAPNSRTTGVGLANVFISYARKDREVVERLAAALEAQGFSIWWDRQIVGGADFARAIERQLNVYRALTDPSFSASDRAEALALIERLPPSFVGRAAARLLLGDYSDAVANTGSLLWWLVATGWAFQVGSSFLGYALGAPLIFGWRVWSV